jgi:branched-chain amino acid transport system permease protein
MFTSATPQNKRFFNYGGMGLFLILLLLPPLIIKSAYLVSILIFICINTILTVGLCLLMGYAGQVSLGHAAFYGLGAYATGIATTRFGMSPWLGLACAMAIPGGLAYFLAQPIFKLKGHYLGMATLGLNYIVYTMLMEGGEITGGPSGMAGLPYLAFGDFAFDSDARYYYLALAGVLFAMITALNIINSRLGRGLRAIHSSEVAAESVGVHTSRLKTRIFVISALYAGLAGGLYAHYLTFINPTPFSFHGSLIMVVMAAVGGLSTIWGAPFGAAVITLLTEALRFIVPKLMNNASGEHETIIFGLLLIILMIYVPEGIARGLSGLFKSGLKKGLAMLGGDKNAGLKSPVLRRWLGLGSQE